MMTVLQDIPVKLLSATQLAQLQEPHLPDPEVRPPLSYFIYLFIYINIK
jgi:hypothetical protein